MTRISFPLFAGALAVAALGVSPAFAYSGAKYEAGATIKMTEATGIALKARPGKVTDRELEHERGGSGLRYSFDIRGTDNVTYEIGVDAMTGAVLENDRESDHPD